MRRALIVFAGIRLARGGSLAALLASVAASAQSVPDSASVPSLPVITVEAGPEYFEVPAAIDRIAVDATAHAQFGVNLSEPLNGVAGLLVRDRQNYAQDAQISIRGFGARAAFGVRGVRLYSDGIPATMPDGQGQLTHFSLDGAESISVLRGPFSALYGNSSAGVIAIQSGDGRAAPGMLVVAGVASDGAFRFGAVARGAGESISYNVALSHFQTDGYRAHSAAVREVGNAKFVAPLGDSGQLTLVANGLALPHAQDPLGLSAAQVDADPRQATPSALQFNTRKVVHQSQAGLIFDTAPADADGFHAVFYAGDRQIMQVLAIPVVAQANPLSGGGVVDLGSGYGGADLRWTHAGTIGGRDFRIDVGVATDLQAQRRRGYENFRADELGVIGALRRDQRDRVNNVDEYAQSTLQLGARWRLLAGLRHSTVRFRSDDAFVDDVNPDDSGTASYRATTPVAGVTWTVTDTLRAYTSAGRGFETPTFAELAYRNDGASGLAFGLRPARTLSREVGLKWRNQSWGAGTAIFDSHSRNELAVLSNVGGRSTYRNIARTGRRGVEWSAASLEESGRWQWRFAYTRLDARFRSAFLACAGSSCMNPAVPIAAGTTMPGVPTDVASLRVELHSENQWRYGIETDAIGAVSANDAGTARAPGYAVWAIDMSRDWRFGNALATVGLRVDNVADRAYIGSVIVNEANSRYFEPGPGRQFSMTARWQL
ncbi:MAG: TonB-dependent receptor [Tahibacter sp.]